MDWAKLVSGVASGAKDDTKSSNTEMSAMLGDIGVALDETDRQRGAAYKDAFTSARQAADAQLAQREQAAGAAAHAAAQAAGPSPMLPATGAAAPQGTMVDPGQVASQAAFARQAMGGGMPQQPMGAVPVAPQVGPGMGAMTVPPNPEQAMMAAYARRNGMV